MTTLERIEARLEEATAALEHADVVRLRRLVARARSGGEAARDRLLAIAEGRLERALGAAAAERQRLLVAIDALGEEAEPYREVTTSGRTLEVARALRRVKRGGRRLLGAPRAAREATPPEAEARSRGPSSIAPPSPALHRYRAAAAEAEADLALLRSKRNLPDLAGRYHGGVVAAEALAIMERIGRGYLVAQLARFEAYGALLALAEELDPAPAAKAMKKKRPSRRKR